MDLRTIREDEKGIFVRTGGYVFRPGDVIGLSHAFRMDDGGARAGDKVHAQHDLDQSAKVVLADGTTLRWASEGEHARDRVARAALAARAHALPPSRVTPVLTRSTRRTP